MMRHSTCGGRHETVAEARECEGNRSAGVATYGVNRPARERVTSRVKTSRVTEDGIYINPGNREIYRVVFAVHGSGKLYASKLFILHESTRSPEGKVIVPAKIGYRYEPGAMRIIQATWKMSRAQAKEFGDLYGCCVKCGRPLTDPLSIERGMGDTCYGKMGAK